MLDLDGVGAKIVADMLVLQCQYSWAWIEGRQGSIYFGKGAARTLSSLGMGITWKRYEELGP